MMAGRDDKDRVNELRPDDIAWTCEPVRRLDFLDLLALTDNELLRVAREMQSELHWFRDLFVLASERSFVLTHQLEAARRALCQQRRREFLR